MIDLLIDMGNRNAGVLEAMIADIPGADLCRQFPNIQNHPAWQAGHLALVRSLAAGMFGKPLDLQAPWLEHCARGTEPTANAADFATKDTVLATFRRAHNHLTQTLAGLTWEGLARPTPHERLAKRMPTLQHVAIGILQMHDGYHLGQLAVWRAAAGLPSTIG